MALNGMQVEKIKSREKRFEVLDKDGLYLRVTPTRHKSWVFRYRFGGIPRRMTLGSYPAVSLATAREKRGEAASKVARGSDPGAEAVEEKAKSSAELTFKDLLDEYWKVELSKTVSCDERKRLVDKDAIPSWGKRKVSSITRREAVLLLDGVRERAPVTANRLQGILVRMFNFASDRAIVDVSPLAGMRRKKENPRSRVLADAEIKTLWECLSPDREDIGTYRLIKLALKAILLTGQRPGEVAGMTWEQLDDAWWVIPADLRKNNEANHIPILPMLADIIEEAKIYSSGSLYVFRSPHDKESHITVGALAMAIRRHKGEIGIPERFTPHDLRRTLRTRLAELGVSDAVAEKVLGHKLQGVLGVYNRHSYDAEKRQALSLWEKRLREILEPSEPTTNVIPYEVRHG